MIVKVTIKKDVYVEADSFSEAVSDVEDAPKRRPASRGVFKVMIVKVTIEKDVYVEADSFSEAVSEVEDALRGKVVSCSIVEEEDGATKVAVSDHPASATTTWVIPSTGTSEEDAAAVAKLCEDLLRDLPESMGD